MAERPSVFTSRDEPQTEFPIPSVDHHRGQFPFDSQVCQPVNREAVSERLQP